MKFGLKESTITSIRAVLARHPQVEKAVLYGLRAKGDYKNGSDIDLTLLGGEDLTLDVLYRIMDDLDDLLLPYKIDLSIFRSIDDPDVVEHIRRVGVAFYEKGMEANQAWFVGVIRMGIPNGDMPKRTLQSK